MPRTLKYIFELSSGQSWRYELQFDDKGHYIPPSQTTYKDWTKLEFHQCPHCPLKKEDSPQCPIAQNLDMIVEDSKETLSCIKAKVTVESRERTYVKECDTQNGLRSLFGVIMASSGCPHLEWLKPLARFHLPFSDIDETLFRVLSLQLVEMMLHGGEAELSHAQSTIKERYKNVEKVNHTFIKRIRSYCKEDADKNAVAALDIFVQMFSLQLENNFESLRPLFGKGGL